jgi:ABC-type nitrate/sulfonate/bicarbonate transport system permease component
MSARKLRNAASTGRRRPRRRAGGALLGVIGIAAILVACELVARLELLPSRWFPPVSSVLATLAEEAAGRDLWLAATQTLTGWGVGLLVACALALPAGLLIGSFPPAYRLVRAVIEFLRPIPSVALIPLAVLLYGSGLGAKVFLVGWAAFWPLLFQVVYGVRDVDVVARDTARVYGLGTLARYLVVVLPSAAPYLATGLRIAASIGLILAVTAELVIGSDGLGRSVTVAQAGGAVTLMYALIVATGLLGLVITLALTALERRLLRWSPSHRAEAAA